MSSLLENPRQVPVLPCYLENDPESRDIILNYLIKAGIQAPSWYNSQPWQIKKTREKIFIYLDDSRDRTLFDWGHFNSLLACGACVENILIAAKSRGIAASVELLPDPTNQKLVAAVELCFEKTLMPNQQAGNELEQAIWKRHTNSLMFENSQLAVDHRDSLFDSIPGDSAITLHLLEGQESKEKVFSAVSLAEQVRFSRRDLHEQLHRMIRWNEKQAYANKTGYTLPSMGVCGFGKTFFRMTRSWTVMRVLNFFGAYRNQASRASQGLLHCSAIGLLTVKGNSEEDLLKAGQVMEGLWLKAAALGLDLQPLNSIIQFHWANKFGEQLFAQKEKMILATSIGLLSDIFSVDLNHGEQLGVFLFRVGNGEPAYGFTLREDIENLSRY